jgi:peptide/nickel transport system substrate-binding protein
VQGELDIIPDCLESGLRTAFREERRSVALQSFTKNKLNTIWLSFDMRRESPWTKNKLLRQALNYCFDMRITTSAAAHVRAGGLLPPGIVGYDPTLKRFNYSPQTVFELLRKAGYPNGKGLPPLRALTPHRNEYYVWDTLKSILSGFQIQFTYDAVPNEKFSYYLEKGDYDLFRSGWIADYPEAINFFQIFYSRSSLNSSHYSNPAFDSFYEQAMKCPDREKRIEYYGKMERILLEDAPALFLWHEVNMETAYNYVTGYAPSVNQFMIKLYKYVKIEKP